MQRTSYQNGSVVRKTRKRGPDVWVFRYMDTDGIQKAERIGTVEKFRTKAAAQKEAAKSLEEINSRLAGITIAGLCDRFELEAMDDIRSKTADTYCGFLKRVRADLGTRRVDDLGRDILSAEAWVNGLTRLNRKPMSKKSKLHYKAFLHRLYEAAMKWNLFPMQRNPMTLIVVKGKHIRIRVTTLLTSEQLRSLIVDPELCQHVRVMVQIAMYLGLRISEILGLRWEDIDFAARKITIQRSSVGDEIDDTKTAASYSELPLHEDLAKILRGWRKANQDDAGNDVSVNDYLFGNETTGRPFWQGTLQQDHLIPAGRKVGIQSLGWHDFRHTYRAMMGELDIPLEQQKTLMRHADISTTLSYGRSGKLKPKSREANAAVVEMVRRSA